MKHCRKILEYAFEMVCDALVKSPTNKIFLQAMNHCKMLDMGFEFVVDLPAIDKIILLAMKHCQMTLSVGNGV